MYKITLKYLNCKYSNFIDAINYQINFMGSFFQLQFYAHVPEKMKKKKKYYYRNIDLIKQLIRFQL